MCPFLSRIKRAHSYRALFHSGLDNHSIRRNHIRLYVHDNSFLSNCPLSNLGFFTGWWGLVDRRGSRKIRPLPGKLCRGPMSFPFHANTSLSDNIYTLSTMTIMIGAGMTSAKKTQKSKSGSREGTKQKSQTLKHFQFCPVDLYLLCIISFPKHSLGKWTVW